MGLFSELHIAWLAARIRELATTPIEPGNPSSMTIRDTVARKFARDLLTDDPDLGVFSVSPFAVPIGIGLTGNAWAARSKPSPETRSTPTTSARLILPSAVVISAPIASVIR